MDNLQFSNDGCHSDWEKRVRKDFARFFSLIEKDIVVEMWQRFIEMNEIEGKALSPIFDSEIAKEYPIKDLVLTQHCKMHNHTTILSVIK